jgi:predicted RecA/RadA family phage recombinase
MMARFIHDGRAVDFFPTETVPAGTVIVQGSLVGMTKADIPAGCLGAVHAVGVYDIEKGNTAVALGGKVYWDATAKKAVINATGNTLLGVAVQDLIIQKRSLISLSLNQNTIHFSLSTFHYL